jgi:SAM-dependent methyltransferase
MEAHRIPTWTRKERFVTYENRARAESFGSRAETYDTYRPTYPDQMIDDLCGGERPRVLDVGCGTGKAARLFAARGCEVLGIEVDERMAERARSHGIPVEVSPFESWDPKDRSFDLVTAGQAWHWVDPETAPPKAADVLGPEGGIALFWNHSHPHDSELEAAIHEVAAPHGEDRFHGRKDWHQHDDLSSHARAIENSGRFAPCDLRSYPWQWLITNEHWISLWLTWSEVAVMPADERAALVADVRSVLDRFGEEILFDYETQCITARKLG